MSLQPMSKCPHRAGQCQPASLLEFAVALGKEASSGLPRKKQKELGQFLTPPDIANFMAQRIVSRVSKNFLRIVDPAAGTGILAAAVVDAILERKENKPKEILVTLYEIDTRLKPSLQRLGYRMKKAAEAAGVKLKVSIRCKDFLLSREALCADPIADILISNPPYFKIRAKDPRAEAHHYAISGQPNIYGLFMAACAPLIENGGQWCFITPRSWTNGAYFSSVRQHILCRLQIDAIHIFESREEHFSDDNILQEAMITWATARSTDQNQVVVSTSQGMQDLASATLQRLPSSEIIGKEKERSISLRIQGDPLCGLNHTLASFGLKVSTGPVVAFRASTYLRATPNTQSVPLLWMQHIGEMLIKWPINKKQEHIIANAASAWMLVPNCPIVILRRFSPKEAARRVIAAPYTGELPGASLGLENHLNYIYRPGGRMTTEETIGLATYLNSRVVDIHFRAVAGSTQVNATELRKLPLPSLTQLISIGQSYHPSMSITQLDQVVEATIETRELSLANA